jgi:predicted nucleic acid-binding protein
MAEVFIDAVAWIAMINTRDSLHQKAMSVFRDLRRQNYSFVTTEFVLMELANALSSPDFRNKVSIFIDGLQQSDSVEVVGGTSDLFSLGFELYRVRLDKEWSLTDCSSFIVMENRQLTTAFTEDHHFEQAGFVKLL